MNRKLSFTIADGPMYWRTHRIMELCDYLTGNVLEPMFVNENTKWERRFMDFFSFDNDCDPLDPTGKIRFEVPLMFAGRVSELESGIIREIGKLKIKLGPFSYARNPLTGRVETIIIPVVENPTALVAPPDVNMSQMRGYLVMRDLLGYQKVNGRYEFAPEDLVSRVSAVTDDKIAACTASPVKLAEGVKRTPSPISIKAVRRCLQELTQFAQWAMRNKHQRLAAT